MFQTKSLLSISVCALLTAACGAVGSPDGTPPEGTDDGGGTGPAIDSGGGTSSGAIGAGDTGTDTGTTSAADASVPPRPDAAGTPPVDASTRPVDATTPRDAGAVEGATGTTGRDATADSAADGRTTTGGGGADATVDSSPTTGGSDACASGPLGTISGALSTGVTFTDTDGKPVNAHGGGIIQVGATFYLHGEFFLSTTTNNDFNGFSMYSSTNLSTWKNEGIILPQQPSGELGPVRKGERPHIIRCPSTGEYVLYAHAASEDYQTDKEVVYATSATVNGQYAFKGSLLNASGAIAAHSDMSAYADSTGAYVLTESGHVYTLASDCHSWLSDQAFSAVNGDSGGSESPTVFRAGSTYYWIGSYKTGWRANNNFYSTAPAVTGPWTFQGFVAPVVDPTNNISDQRTWLTQSTWVQPITGCSGTVYVYWGDHWYGNQDTTAPGLHNNLATYVFQPLTFTGTKISMPTYLATWTLNVGAGTWSQ